MTGYVFKEKEEQPPYFSTEKNKRTRHTGKGKNRIVHR